MNLFLVALARVSHIYTNRKPMRSSHDHHRMYYKYHQHHQNTRLIQRKLNSIAIKKQYSYTNTHFNYANFLNYNLFFLFVAQLYISLTFWMNYSDLRSFPLNSPNIFFFCREPLLTIFVIDNSNTKNKNE